jgi:hypothetical protein
MKFFSKEDATQPRGNKKTFLQRFRPLSVAALVVISLFVATISPFFPNQASAVTANDILTRAQAWSILSAVVANGNTLATTVSLTDVNNCHIFGNNNTNVYVGPHATGNPNDNGESWDQLEANTGNINAALNSVGINGCQNLLEKIGYTYGNGSVMNQPANLNLFQAVNAAITVPDPFYGAKFGGQSPGDALTYAMLYADLTSACGWQYKNPYVANDQSQTTAGSANREAQANGHLGDNVGSNYYTYTYENGVAGNNTYYKNGGRNDGVYIGPDAGFGPPSTPGPQAKSSCSGDTADGIPSYLASNPRFANAYAAMLKPGGAFTPGTCKDKYTTQAELDACNAGYLNKSDANYCKTTYATNQTLLNACTYGATTATGGENSTTPPTTSTPGAGTPAKPTCTIQGIGWIICPVVNFLAQVVDAAYSIVGKLLTVQPLLTTQSSGGASPIYSAWSIMRNFANVAFVIAFLFIIFSQLTSVGISNYGIKKMLPKIIVAAVLVNVSYWICSIAVDISNILGSSIDQLLQGTKSVLTPPDLSKNAAATGAGWTGIAGGILAGAVTGVTALYIGLSALLPVLITVLITILVVFLVLTLRQALIILLIVVSPLAFVAYLLPNTESLFKKWRELFQTLLLMYPLISLIFGASALGSTIIMNSANGSIAIEIMGAGVSILPLIILPAFIKGAHSILSNFSNKVPHQGVTGKLQKGAENIRNRQEGRREIRALNGGPSFARRTKYRRRAKSAAVTASIANEVKRAQTSFVASKAQSSPAFANQLAGGQITSFNASPAALQRAMASAKFTIEKVEAEEVNAHHATIDTLDESQLMAVINDSSSPDTKVAAALERLVQVGKTDNIADAVDKYGSGGESTVVTRTLADALKKDGPAFLKASDIDNIQRGQLGHTTTDPTTGTTKTIAGSMAEMTATNIESGVLSEEKMVAANSDQLAYASRSTTAAGQARLQKTAAELKANTTLNGKIKHNAKAINDLEATGYTTGF